jgi:hypothetical protein
MAARKRNKREAKRAPFPWSDPDHALRCVVISKVDPEDLVSLIAAVTYPGSLPARESPLDDQVWRENHARRYLSRRDCEDSEIVGAARLFDFEKRCEGLYDEKGVGSPKESFHRDSLAGFARRPRRDMMRLAELGSIARRCRMLVPRMRRRKDLSKTLVKRFDGTCRSVESALSAENQDLERCIVRLCHDLEIRFTLIMTRRPIKVVDSRCCIRGETAGEGSIVGSTTVSFLLFGEQCSFWWESSRDMSLRSTKAAPVTHASFRNEHAHVFDAWVGAPCSLIDEQVRVVAERDGRLEVDEGAWAPFEAAVSARFGPRSDIRVDGETVSWEADFHDMQAEMEVFVGGSERAAIKLNTDDIPGLATLESRGDRSGSMAYWVFAWDDVLRFMLKTKTESPEDPWERGTVEFSLAVQGPGRRSETRPTLESEEAWFQREGTVIPTAEFLERLIAQSR